MDASIKHKSTWYGSTLELIDTNDNDKVIFAFEPAKGYSTYMLISTDCHNYVISFNLSEHQIATLADMFIYLRDKK